MIAGLLCALAIHSAASQPASAADLDREFYNDYLDSLPNERQVRQETLERNLLSAVVRNIPREDPFSGPQFVRNLTASGLRYQRITRASAFVRGIFQELPYLKETEFMWIVRAGNYTVFVSYRANPERFVQSEFQIHTIVRSAPPADSHSDDPG
ncbi:MAG: hypothetical protein K1X75_11045 [Leptospirales bacterium]|nr:hypothetical protein [Leptospirales bacterium]